MLLFDKNLHIIILTKKKLFFTRDTNYFTLPQAAKNAAFISRRKEAAFPDYFKVSCFNPHSTI